MSGGNYICNKIDTIDSTNDYLKQNYHKIADRFVLWTTNQTNGRGRNLRSWKCDDDLAFSILFKEKYHNAIIAPLAILMALETYNIKTIIKWPNDIYYNGKKLAGILIEDIYCLDFEASIVGIGINYFDKNEFSGIGLKDYVSIEKEELINKVLFFYEELINTPLDLVINLYKSNNFILYQNIKYRGEKYLVCDITTDGFLVLGNGKEYIHVQSNEIDIKTAIQ